jgi:hypothetical protein
MAIKTDLLYAAAIAGIWEGVRSGADFSSIDSASLTDAGGATLTAAIAAAAAEIDQTIGFDATLAVSSSSPVMLVTPFAGSGTAAQLLPFFTRPALLQGICAAAFKGKGDLTSAVPSTYSIEAAGIAAQYSAALAQLPTS